MRSTAQNLTSVAEQTEGRTSTAATAVNEAQGQRSEFTLSAFNAKPSVKSDTFTFKVPDGVTIDDQR